MEEECGENGWGEGSMLRGAGEAGQGRCGRERRREAEGCVGGAALSSRVGEQAPATRSSSGPGDMATQTAPSMLLGALPCSIADVV